MTPEIMRQYLAAHAPELEVVELPEAHTTESISREWKVLPAQVAKTLTLRAGEDAIIVVTCGDSSGSEETRSSLCSESSRYSMPPGSPSKNGRA